MSIRTDFTTRWLLISYFKDQASKDSKDISFLHRLKPHLACRVILLVDFVDLSEQWSQSMSIKVPRNRIGRMAERIAKEGLVERVISYHIWVVCILIAHVIPVVDELISKTEFVIVDCFKSVD